ncbi:hypothetical protein [Arthrobacter zhaoguopingii]|uniref:hypothetical protein n=1 Tax=Arthrobacter zhaoguopingii TaxID=2681491 RepID=UPI00135BC3B2|nr:hypothetical protein [Arthrobacter zhaoguopingii]
MLVVGLMADSGLPERLAGRLAEPLREALTSRTGPGTRWNVEVSRQELPLDRNGRVPLMERAEALRAANGWDLVVYVTDLPRVHDHQTLLTESDGSAGAALVSLPALGGFRARSRLEQELVRVVSDLAARSGIAPRGSGSGRSPGGVRGRRRAGNAAHVHETVPGPLGRTRLLTGMVRSNRPGRLVGSLSNAAAAAMATGAFGIFYASIWSMADASSTLRLSLISVLAVTALTGWLIVHNGLWSQTRTDPNGTPAAMDNAATVITVFLSVAAMYGVLYLAVLLGSLAVISGQYMQTQLGHPVSIVEYANLSWLAASLGTLAGALGSNFDGDEAVQKATYSRREHERRRLGEKKAEAGS